MLGDRQQSLARRGDDALLQGPIGRYGEVGVQKAQQVRGPLGRGSFETLPRPARDRAQQALDGAVKGGHRLPVAGFQVAEGGHLGEGALVQSGFVHHLSEPKAPEPLPPGEAI